MIWIVVLAIVGGGSLTHTAPFPFLLEAFAGETAVWRMKSKPGDRTVYLTFDDGPNPAATPQLLDLLRDKDVRATFFIIPEHLNESTAPILRRMFAEGHAVALHSGNRWLMLRSPSGFVKELEAGAARLEQLAGSRPCPAFRPHGGWRSIPMLLGLKRAGFKLVGWSWLSFDWVWFRQRTPERVARQILARASPGQIIVIHDGHHKNPRAERRYAIEAAGRIIDDLKERGYQFGAVC